MNRKNAVRGGINRAVAILLLLVVIMLVLLAAPAYRAYKFRAEKIGCAASLKTAKDSLAIEVLTENEALTKKTAYETLARTMPGRDLLCPSGGTVYFIPLESGTYDLVCGLHGGDAKQRTRLNAAEALNLVSDAVRLSLLREEGIPDTVSITLNGRELVCHAVSESLSLRRGTSSTNGYEGTVVFYGIAGQEGWQDPGLEENSVCYFVYADEDHAAVWDAFSGWKGDSYTGLS